MTLRIYLKKEIGENCTSIDDGSKVLQLISPELVKGSSVEIDFKEVNSVLTPFLNASFGNLLERFGKEVTMTNVIIRNISDEFLKRINGFVDRKDVELTKSNEQKMLQEMFDEDDLTDTSL